MKLLILLIIIVPLFGQYNPIDANTTFYIGPSEGIVLSGSDVDTWTSQVGSHVLITPATKPAYDAITQAVNFVTADTDYLYAETASAGWADFGTGDFTIDFWVKFTDINLSSYIISKRTLSSNTYYLYQYQGIMSFYCTLSGTMNISTPMTSAEIASGVWYCISYVADRDGNGLWYVNGSPVETTTNAMLSGDITMASEVTVGARATSHASYFGGSMTILRVSNKARTAAECLLFYQNGKDGNNLSATTDQPGNFRNYNKWSGFKP